MSKNKLLNRVFHSSILTLCILFFEILFAQNVLPDTLVFGSDNNYPPYEFIDDNGNPAGFNVDLIKVIAEEMDFNLEIKLGSWPEIRKEFENEGSIHITDMYYSEDRDEKLDFATAHKIQYSEILVQSTTNNIKTLSDLNYKKVILQESALAQEYIESKLPSATIILVDSEYEAIKALSEGLGDATIISSTTTFDFSEFSNIKNIGYSFLPSEYCFVVMPKNDMVLRLINQGLMTLKENGKFAEIDKKWFGNEPNKIVRNLLIGVILIITIIALVFYWLNSTLRNLVKKRTQDLKYSLERLSLISSAKGKPIGKLKLKDQVNERIKFIVKTFNVDACNIKFLKGEELILFTSYSINNFDISKLKRREASNFSEQNIKNQAVYFPNESNKLPFENCKFYARAPLIVEGNFIGTIEMFSKSELTKFSSIDLEHLVLVADQLAVLIANTKLFEQNISQKEALIKQNKIQEDTEKDLLAAKEKAEESNRLKSAFLANMSHEIRTPMNGIIGFAEILKNPEIDKEKQLKYIDIVNISSKRLLNIINDIIDISKIESGTLELYFSDVSIEKTLTNNYTFFNHEAINKGLELKLKKTDFLHEIIIRTDENKLNAILINLIKNAIKYTKEGTIEFGCTIEEEVLCFFVKDTGIGIPEDRQGAIFQRFIQADIEDREVYEGAGLGLALAKLYTEMLGGVIRVESSEKGSQFYFSIPFDDTNISEEDSKLLVCS